jgi:hypothetical protein
LIRHSRCGQYTARHCDCEKSLGITAHVEAGIDGVDLGEPRTADARSTALLMSCRLFDRTTLQVTTVLGEDLRAASPNCCKRRNPSALLPPELGLTGFVGDRARVSAASARCTAWPTYNPSLRLEPRSTRMFSIRTDAWTGVLIFYARADFGGDGIEDVFVRRNGKADGGSDAASALLF